VEDKEVRNNPIHPLPLHSWSFGLVQTTTGQAAYLSVPVPCREVLKTQSYTNQSESGVARVDGSNSSVVGHRTGLFLNASPSINAIEATLCGQPVIGTGSTSGGGNAEKVLS
jgi:hypothetical protein